MGDVSQFDYSQLILSKIDLWTEQIAWYQRLQVDNKAIDQMKEHYPFPIRPQYPDYVETVLKEQEAHQKEMEELKLQQKRAAEAEAVITHSEEMKQRLAAPRKKLAEPSPKELEDVI